MPLGEIAVDPKWREIEERQERAKARSRTSLQLALLAYGLAALGIAGGNRTSPWLDFAQGCLFAAAFVGIPLWLVLRDRTSRPMLLGVTSAALAGAWALTFLTTPTEFRGRSWAGVPLLSPWLVLFVPLATVALLLWARRQDPGRLRSLGFSSKAWGYQAIIGISLGSALGFHLWITASALPRTIVPQPASLTMLVWTLVSTAGLAGLGEELALRGLLYRSLAEESHGMTVGVFSRILALGAPLYLAPVLAAPYAANIPLGLLYGTCFGILAIVLRFSLRSVVAPLAANVVFSVFMALVLQV